MQNAEYTPITTQLQPLWDPCLTFFFSEHWSFLAAARACRREAALLGTSYQWAPYSFFRILSLQFKKSTSFAPYPGTYYLSTSVRMSSSGSFSSQPPVLSVFTGLCPRSQSCQSEFPRDFRKLSAIVNCHWTVIGNHHMQVSYSSSFVSGCDPSAVAISLSAATRAGTSEIAVTPVTPVTPVTRARRISTAASKSPTFAAWVAKAKWPLTKGSKKRQHQKKWSMLPANNRMISWVWPKMIDPCSNPGKYRKLVLVTVLLIGFYLWIFLGMVTVYTNRT